MDIHVLGVGESADPALPNSSVIVSADGFRLMIDCGHSVPPVLWRELPDPDAVDALCFTHHHPDHCFGLVPALIRWTDDRRSKPLGIVTTADGRRQLGQLFQAGGIDPERSLSFPLQWSETPAEGEVGPFRIRTAPTLHAIPNLAIRLEAGGKSFAYSGDGRATEESEALFRGADLLFHECLTVEPDRSQPFHAAYTQLSGLPDRLAIRAMRLYHVRRDLRRELAAACAADPRIALAIPGERIAL
ncbi:MBL fold metallo-hydrolase [Azospirillum thermophilum]|uniref:Ribonuclease Z n=1 Tax=Azospirillum thermophilum TaxID=2202148 RepID=A0A2S2CWI5_9PROT|nr:ribonuclease Z [Azospirillum thermophilum]AWK88657.1 ribonuclease Z [Azospirillum thermophilum]